MQQHSACSRRLRLRHRHPPAALHPQPRRASASGRRPAQHRPCAAARSRDERDVLKDVSELGFAGLELFDWQITGLENQGLLGRFVEKYKLPLISSYTSIKLTDPAQHAETIAAAISIGNHEEVRRQDDRHRSCGRVGGASYNFDDHKQNIVTTLNELGKAVTDIGLIAALHQHTGTAVETRDETYATMEAVDTRYVKFGRTSAASEGRRRSGRGRQDVPAGRPALHFKDWNGGPSMAGYCALGLGKVDLVGVLDLMEGRKLEGMIMVELDGGGQMPYTAREAAKIAHDWLVKHGVTMKA